MSRNELHTLLSSTNTSSFTSTRGQSERHSSEPAALTPARRILPKISLQRRNRRNEQRSHSLTARTINRFRSNLILLDAQEMCLCGLLSISHSVHLILCIEVFFALILLMQAPDLLTMDGTYFYFLGFFHGRGLLFFTLHVSLCTSCLISSALLYIGSQCQKPLLIIPHVLWQFSFILVALLSIIVLLILGIGGKMLLPSSIVLSMMMTVAGGCEIWWCLLSIVYYRHVREQKNHRFSTAISQNHSLSEGKDNNVV